MIVLGINYGPDEDPLARARPARPRDDLGLCPPSRLSRADQGPPQAARRLAARRVRRRGQGVRRHRAGAREAARRARRDRLAGQAQQPGLAPLRLLAVPRRDLDRPARSSPTRPRRDHCGSCRACLDVCPTDAFPAPYQLDARRCISYLTIEHQGHIAREFRAADRQSHLWLRRLPCGLPVEQVRADRDARPSCRRATICARRALAELARLDDAGFRRRFAGSPIKRTGRDRFVRNVLIAIGNSGDPRLAALAEERLADASPLVRAMAVWALAPLRGARCHRSASGAAPARRDATRAVARGMARGARLSGACSASASATPRWRSPARCTADGLAGRRHHPRRRQAGPPRRRRLRDARCSRATGRSRTPRRRSPARPTS